MNERAARRKKRETVAQLVDRFVHDHNTPHPPERIPIDTDGISRTGRSIALAATLATVAPPTAFAQQPPAAQAQAEELYIQAMLKDMEQAPASTLAADVAEMSDADRKCLIDNVYHEARGEIRTGRYAVIFSTLSRVLSGKYPNSVCGVVHQPWQFSWTKDEKILAQRINPKAYLEIARDVFNLTKGRTIDEAAILAGMEAQLPHGAIFYKRAGFVGSPRVQAFFATLQSVGTVGNHEFFVVPEKKASK
ncbi:MAG: cell wall hydrolase [Candidatus Pacebacteria bacterium]|nr:cell wall hydrolase [Candidatus Paceibacterota bacterium]